MGLDCFVNSYTFIEPELLFFSSSDDEYSEDSWVKCDGRHRALLPPCIDAPGLPSPVPGGFFFAKVLPEVHLKHMHYQTAVLRD